MEQLHHSQEIFFFFKEQKYSLPGIRFELQSVYSVLFQNSVLAKAIGQILDRMGSFSYSNLRKRPDNGIQGQKAEMEGVVGVYQQRVDQKNSCLSPLDDLASKALTSDFRQRR